MASIWLIIQGRIRRGFGNLRRGLHSRPSSPTDSLTDSIPAPKQPLLFPKWPPPTPQELLAYREYYVHLFRQQFRYRKPEGETEDKPLFGLYRLYEYLVLNDIINVRNNVEYFFNHHQWAVEDIPDPKDSDPARYALLACIPHLLVDAFNNNIGIGIPRDAPGIITYEQLDEFRAREKKFEKVPAWTFEVPPLKETLSIPDEDGIFIKSDDYYVSAVFKEKNILIQHPHVRFI